MPIEIETAYTIQPDTQDPRMAWKVSTDNIKQLDNFTFIKLISNDHGFIRLICAGVLQLPKKSRFSLMQTPGWTKLMKLRNDAAFQRDAVSAEAALFDTGIGSIGALSKRKRPAPRMKSTQLQQLRDARTIMEITVPGCAGNPDFDVRIIKPVHPAEGLWLHCDAVALQHIIDFIREDLTMESLTMRRAYGQECKGIWHNGSAGLVQKVVGDREEPNDSCEIPEKKWRSVKGSAPELAPISDAGNAHSEEVACVEDVEVDIQPTAQSTEIVMSDK